MYGIALFRSVPSFYRLALLMILLLFSASIWASATCGFSENNNNGNIENQMIKEPVKSEIPYNNSMLSEDVQLSSDKYNYTTLLNNSEKEGDLSTFIPHLSLEIIRPVYGEVFTDENPDITILVATKAGQYCTGDECKNYSKIDDVEIFEDLNLLGKATESYVDDINSLWEYNWKDVEVGTYIITAMAINCRNQLGISSPIIITVRPENYAPRVLIISPYDGQIFTSPATIPIKVLSWDTDDNISKLEVFEGSNKIGEDNTVCKTGKTCIYNLSWDEAKPGLYQLKATAENEMGIKGTSSPLSVFVKPNETIAEWAWSIETKTPIYYSTSLCEAALYYPYDTVGTLNPTYIWSSVPNATRYRLKVDGPSGIVINKWYNASEVTSEWRCSITPSEGLVLNAEYRWSIQTGNRDEEGPISPYKNFSVERLIPEKVLGIKPKGLVSVSAPTFSWTTIPGSTQYRLIVENDEEETVMNKSFEMEQVISGYTCKAISPRTFGRGVYFWRARAENDFGDIGNWSSWLMFEIVCPSTNESNQINASLDGINPRRNDNGKNVISTRPQRQQRPPRSYRR